jgi:hypothetical protein
VFSILASVIKNNVPGFDLSVCVRIDAWKVPMDRMASLSDDGGGATRTW